MPLRALLAPPAPAPGDGFVPRPPRIVESPYLSWTPAGGPELILGEQTGPVVAQRGIHGLDMPPEEQHETSLAVGDGAILNHARAGVREVMIPVRLTRAASLDESEHQRRELLAAFDRRRGPGTLLWALLDGTRRTLTALYSRGLESSVLGHRGALRHTEYQIILRAHDPYWYGDEQTIKFTPPVGGDLHPLPFTISSSTTTGDSDVLIDGEVEVEVWPVWALHGPMFTATLRNRDTGRTLQLTPSLAAGQALTVRTDPRTLPTQRITRETGANVWEPVAGQFPVMWPLRSGLNRVTVTAAGTASTSLIALIYRPRYLSV
jgi:hypothetical protein